MTASLLPNGEQQFIDGNGVPYALGEVFFYIPSTLDLKNTWQNAGKTILNTNPVNLDAAGRAIIYGDGQYRQILLDSLGNTIWDQLTQSTLSTGDVGFYTGGTSTGSANSQIVSILSPSGFSLSHNGATVAFTPGFTNLGSLQLNLSGTGLVTVQKEFSGALVNLTGGEVVAGATAMVTVNTVSGTLVLTGIPANFGGNFLQTTNNLSDVVSAATSRTNLSVSSIADIQNMANVYAVATGTTSAYLANITPAPAGLTVGMKITIDSSVVGTNTVIGPTFRLNGLGSAVRIYGNSGATFLPVGGLPFFAELELSPANVWVCLNQIYSFSNTFTSSEIAVAAANVAHGLGAIPFGFSCVIRCKTAEAGYSVGDEVALPGATYAGGAGGTISAASVSANATTLYYNATNAVPEIANRSTGAAVSITAANWKIVFRAWL